LHKNPALHKTVEYIVTGQTANLRSGPGTGYDVVSTVNGGDILLIYDETPETAGWFRIYREGESDAYICRFSGKTCPHAFYPQIRNRSIPCRGPAKPSAIGWSFPKGFTGSA
jgi:hypothetical protein